ncbi:chemotaxis protein CheB [Hydrogenophilus thiooxidans]|uniref:chemotaxis protein CheB n=1 Tax=Hydrogenophilus thiooxidans TaxID=2820326 RepID=UPI001C22E655|nr:chemotaxis protein CheB [Hydrogenophilus thiooxidans]
MKYAPWVVVIGSSTGGTTVLETILAKLPRTVPAIVIVQHMPAGFTVPSDLLIPA